MLNLENRSGSLIEVWLWSQNEIQQDFNLLKGGAITAL